MSFFYRIPKRHQLSQVLLPSPSKGGLYGNHKDLIYQILDYQKRVLWMVPQGSSVLPHRYLQRIILCDCTSSVWSKDPAWMNGKVLFPTFNQPIESSLNSLSLHLHTWCDLRDLYMVCPRLRTFNLDDCHHQAWEVSEGLHLWKYARSRKAQS
jgi:hypothetical protein